MCVLVAVCAAGDSSIAADVLIAGEKWRQREKERDISRCRVIVAPI